MKQETFVARHEGEWRALEAWLVARATASQARRHAAGSITLDDLDFAASYRRACQHLSIAKRRGYSPVVLDRLEQLMQRGHDVLYRPPSPRWRRIADFFACDFPAQVRRHWRYMAWSALMLFAPMLTMGLLLQQQPELAYSVFGQKELAGIERMYDPASPSHALGRESGSNLQMFGYYIYNNVGIGFRTFASGLLFGVGSLWVLAMNGVMIGTVAGHLTAIGSGGPFWRFVSGHSAPELIAIVLAGGAGLRLGWSLVSPGQLSRARALREAARDGAQLVLGVFALLVFAAFVEAYWSSIGWMPSAIKFSVGGLLWLAIGYWFVRGGRHAA